MKVASFQGVVENGQIRLPSTVWLPEKAIVYVVVPDLELPQVSRILSPRLVYAAQAADVLLKALEEPPADSIIITTAADPNALLPTILSRVVLVRLARISDSDVTVFAQQRLGITDQAELAQRVTAAEGCIGKLFATIPVRSGLPGGPGGDQAARFLEAPWLFALGQVPFQARGGFTDMLDSLASRLRSEAQRGGDTGKLVEAIALVLDARDMAQGNVNPQLLAAVLAEDLHQIRLS